jgi:hypothetical protein
MNLKGSTMAARRITNGKPALAHWIGDGETRLAKCKVLAQWFLVSLIGSLEAMLSLGHQKPLRFA